MGMMRSFGIVSLLVVAGACLASERGSPHVESYDAQTLEGAHISTQVGQMPDGRLVVANMRGLLRFDGVRWELAKHPRGLGGMEHLSLGPDARLHTSFNGDIGYFQDDAFGVLEWHSLLERVPLGNRSFDRVEDVSYDWKRHATWIKTSDQVVFIPDADGEATVISAGPNIRFGGLVGDEYWIQHSPASVTSRINPDAGFALEEIPGNELARDYLLIRSAPGDGDIKLATTEGRLLSYRDGRLSVWTDVLHSADNSPNLRGLVHLRDGRYVVGSFAFPATVLDARGNIVDRYDEADGIPGDRRTHFLFEDREGDLWLAQDRTITKISIAKAVTVFDESRGLPSASGATRWKGQLYASSFSGLFRLEAEDGPGAGRFERVLPDLSNVRMIAALDENTLLVDGAGLRAGTRHQGLQAITMNAAGNLVPTPVDSSMPVEVLEASRFVPGRVWIGHGKGVQWIERDAGGHLLVSSVPLLTSSTYKIGELDDHTIWVADRVDGVTRVDIHGAVPPRRYGPAEGLPEGQVRIYPGAHQPWFTTMLGLRIYDAASDRFVIPAGLPESLHRERLFSVLEDQDENLWVRGGEILNDLFWRTSDGWRSDGSLLYVVPPNPTIFGFLREGNIAWAIRATGLLRYDLAAHKPLGAPPLPVLTRVQDLRAKASVALDGLASLGTRIRDVRFEFALPVLNRPDATSYRSRLAGFDGEWSDWGTLDETKRVFTNLPDGDYRFEVEAQDAYLRIAAMPDIAVGIEPPWWRTAFARISYVLAGLLALWLASRWGARRRRHHYLERQRELEAVVEERTGELRLSNLQLAEQAERLAEVDRLKTRFFINVGHEFRTPLTLVLGPIDDLLRDVRERFSVRAREQLEMAHRNARRVLDLIVELLDVNRFEHGQMRLSLAAFDLTVIARRSLEDHRPVFDRFGHRGTLVIDGDGPWLADVDPVQIERCIGNLLGNAAKYMARGGEITLRLKRQGEAIEIAVSDQGVGISDAALPHVYDRFFQAEGSDSASGYGIGLALVREIIEAHSGNADVESILGVGSKFTLRLPAHDPAVSNAPAHIVPAPEALDIPGENDDALIRVDPGRPLILIVDDHDDLRARARGLLQDRFEVIEAADGPSAWNLARDRLPDLIVCDVMMPGFDGIELTQRLRSDADTAAIALLLLTAKAGTEHAVAGLASGADDYLSKPFDASELLARIDALLARAHRLRLRLMRESSRPPVVESATLPPEQRWLQRLDAIVAEYLDRSEFGVEELAREMHADRSQLFRKCKELLHLSPSEYLRDQRLQRGHTLLEERAGNVSEVAYAVGYDSLSSFTRAFKARYGRAPSQVPAARKAV
jgi:signal transduction histidine kinase/DNA-binding response OmpR family regulator